MVHPDWMVWVEGFDVFVSTENPFQVLAWMAVEVTPCNLIRRFVSQKGWVVLKPLDMRLKDIHLRILIGGEDHVSSEGGHNADAVVPRGVEEFMGSCQGAQHRVESCVGKLF